MEPTAPTLDDGYFKMHCLIYSKAPQIFRQVFKKKWMSLDNNEWENNAEFGTKFIQGIGSQLYQSSQKIQKSQLQSGNIETWDLLLILDAIKSLSTLDKEIENDFGKLKQIRNKLAHIGDMQLEKNDFLAHWTTSETILSKYGLTSQEIQQMQNLTLSPPPQISNLVNNEKARKLKEEANMSFNDKEYWKAIKIYTEAMKVENLGSVELGIFYSNRSAAFAAVNFIAEAKDDAKFCINLRPEWSKGYYRLAVVYEKQEKYNWALKNYRISLKYDPNYKNCIDGEAYCVHMIAKRSRQEHLDPLLLPVTNDDNKKNGILSNPVTEQMQKVLFNLEVPHFICTEAHKYLHGIDGMQQNYEMAAKLFSKAASKGNAEGMYNLACLTADGKGVKRSAHEAIKLHLQAASQEPVVEFPKGSGLKIRCIGVMEAQHSLGLIYENGVGVPKNVNKAIDWYTKALHNGCGFSANNLGLIYAHNVVLKTDFDKALLYFKVGSLMGTVRAIENVVFHYRAFCYGPDKLGFMDNEKARKWCAYALRKGSLHVEIKSMFKGEIMPKSCVDEFESELEAELLESSMKSIVEFNNLCPDGLADRRKARLKRMQKPQEEDTKTKFVVRHRKSLNETRSIDRQGHAEKTKGYGEFAPAVAPNLFGLQPIMLKEMDNSVDDKIYEGFGITLRGIEDANTWGASICLLTQDEKDALIRVFVYNYSIGSNIQQELGFGCSFTIINPYHRRMNDGLFAIRVDDPNLLIKHPNNAQTDKCRFCGVKGSKIACRKCKRVFYCTKLCMKKDEGMFQHNLVCFKKL